MQGIDKARNGGSEADTPPPPPPPPPPLVELSSRVEQQTARIFGVSIAPDRVVVEEFPKAKWKPTGEYASHQTVTTFESKSVPSSDGAHRDDARYFVAQIPLNRAAIQHINQPAKPRVVNCWNLKSQQHCTDLYMPPCSLWIKTGGLLWDWRFHMRAAPGAKDYMLSQSTDTAEDNDNVLIAKFFRLPLDEDGSNCQTTEDSFGYVPAVADVERKRSSIQDMPQLRDLLTIVITTSPIRSNPSTELLEKVVATFAHAGAEFAQDCRKVIVCDGVRVSASSDDDDNGNNNNGVSKRHNNIKQAMRNGIVTPNQAERYDEFKEALQRLCARGDLGSNVEVVELEERMGYGFALRHALRHCVDTPFVCVIQHDRTFMRPTPMRQIVHAMYNHPNIKYIGLSMRSNLMYRDIFNGKYGYADELGKMILRPSELWVDAAGQYGPDAAMEAILKSSHSDQVRKSIGAVSSAYWSSHQYTGQQEWSRQQQAKEDSAPVEDSLSPSAGKHALSLTPTLFWYDNVHVCETAHYRDFIFHESYKMVARGGFVEDKASPVLIRTVERLGLQEGHARFGCYLLDDHSGLFYTGHLDGGSYFTAEQRKQTYASRNNSSGQQ